MKLDFEEFTHDNYNCATLIQRDDIIEAFVDVPSTIMAILGNRPAGSARATVLSVDGICG